MEAGQILALLLTILVLVSLLGAKEKTEKNGDDFIMNNSILTYLAKHPTMDPNDISDSLLLKPNIVQKSGAQIITPTGRKINSVYKETRWTYEKHLSNEDNFKTELSSLLDSLYLHREFVRLITSSGGSSIIYVNFETPEALCLNIDLEVMEKMTDMKINFGIEVFD